CRFVGGAYIDVQVAQYKIIRGGSHIDTPKKVANTKGTINPDNSVTKDNLCLLWAICAFNAYRLTEGKQNNLQQLSVLRQYKDLVNFGDIMDGKPVPVSNHIFEKLEKLNPDYYFNVYDWDDKEGMQPLIISKNFTRKYEVNLLVLNEESIGGKEKTHYLWVKNPSKLIFSNTKNNNKKHLCTGCGEYFSSERVLLKHKKYSHSNTNAPQFTELPVKGKNNKLSFKKWKHMMRAPCVIYSDFEAYNKKCPDGEVYRGRIKKLTENVPNSYHMIVKWSDGAIWTNDYPYRSENPTEHFIKELENLIGKITDKLSENIDIRYLKDEPEYKEEYEKAMCAFNKADKCWICKKGFQDPNKEDLAEGNRLKAEAQKINDNKKRKKAMDTAMTMIRDVTVNKKVWDHDHISGKYRGASHSGCNLKLKIDPLRDQIPVIFHNFRNYDSHIVCQSAGKAGSDHISVIAENIEKYKSMTIGKFKFIDSFQFMNTSLRKLVENLGAVPCNNNECVEHESRIDKNRCMG